MWLDWAQGVAGFGAMRLDLVPGGMMATCPPPLEGRVCRLNLLKRLPLIPCRCWKTAGATKASPRHCSGAPPVSAPPTPALPSSGHRCGRASRLSWGKCWFRGSRPKTHTYVPLVSFPRSVLWSPVSGLHFQTFHSCLGVSVPLFSGFSFQMLDAVCPTSQRMLSERDAGPQKE